jgi:Ca-activated chloride channel family protein
VKLLYSYAIAWAVSALMLQDRGPAPPEPKLRIISPTSTERLTGDVVLSAEVEGSVAKGLQFFVDGALVCYPTAAPFECHWNAGPALDARTVRVVALLADGQRLVGTVRTTGSTALFHSSSEVVLVPVRVTDKHGEPLTDFARDDFEIKENGRPQLVTLFLPHETPCSILIALDVSGSMTPNMDRLKSAVHGFFTEMRPQDRVSLATFTTDWSIVRRPDAPLASKLSAVDALRAGGGTALYDAMAHAADALKHQPGPRALVMFTDGEDVSSRATVEGARVALQEADVVLFLVAQGNASSDARLKQQLSTLARETGGEAFFTSKMNGVPEQFSEILSYLSRQYLLGYAPAAPLGDGAWRTIEVAVTKRDGTHRVVHARAGYFATRRGPSTP